MIGDLKRTGANARDDHGTPVNPSSSYKKSKSKMSASFARESMVSNASTVVDDAHEDDDFVELGGTPEGAREDDDEDDEAAKKKVASPDVWSEEPVVDQEPPRRMTRAQRAAARAAKANDEDASCAGLETPARSGADGGADGGDTHSHSSSEYESPNDGHESANDDDVNLGGTPEGAADDDEDDDVASQRNEGAPGHTPCGMMSPADRFRRSNVEVRAMGNQRPGGMWASIGSPMTAPFQGHNNAPAPAPLATPLANSIDRLPTPAPSISKKRAAMRMSLPANMLPMTPIPISRQVLERIECLGPELNIVQRMMLVVGILLDFYSKSQLVRELYRFARAGSWVWFSMVLTFFVFSAFCITGYWVLHYPMPAKPAEGTVGKDNKVFGFSKYDFKVIVRRFGATCAMFQLGTAFAAWRALRTNDVRARKAEMDLRGMQLVDTIFLTLPVATLQAYIGMSCSAPGSACPGREGFDILLFFAVAGAITSGTLCFVSLDLHEKPPAYSWPEYWRVHKSHLSEMMAKACYRFFELAARILTLGLFAAVTGGYVFLVFFFHACIILGLIKLRLPGVHDRKVWEKLCETREFTIRGRKVRLPVLDDMKLLVACLIWPPSSYVSNAADRKGKFWWRSTSCPRKSFWGLTREDALIPFAVVIGVLAFESAVMIIIIASIAEEHWYFYLCFAVAVNFLWLISAVNWMSAAALWNPFVPEGPPLGYPSVSAINNAIGGRQLLSAHKKTPMMSTPMSKSFSPSPALMKKRLPLEPVGEERQSSDSQSTPVFGRKADAEATTPSLGPRTTPVMIKGSPRPVEVYVDMGDDSAEMNEDDEIPPMVMASLGEEQMLRQSLQWRESLDLQRTDSGRSRDEDQDDLEAARDALNFLNTTDDGSQFVGGTPCLASPAPYANENEHPSEEATPEDGLANVSPILAPSSPRGIKSPR